MNRTQILQRRIKWLTWFFIAGLLVSGLTAIPVRFEVDQLIALLGMEERGGQLAGTVPGAWLFRVQAALAETETRSPFLFYGTDWLAFGHFVIAIAFIGALRDPVRNRWLFDFGMLACALVIPYALIFGGGRLSWSGRQWSRLPAGPAKIMICSIAKGWSEFCSLSNG
jgi:hypothetical protein